MRFLKAEPLAAFRRKRNSFAGYTQEGVKKQSGGLFFRGNPRRGFPLNLLFICAIFQLETAFSTLSPVGMPFARKSKIFGLHSLLLRYPKKIYALSAYFFRPRRHNKLFYSATGGNRLLSSANTTPVPLKTRLLSGFSLTRSFFDAPVAGKTKFG